MRKGQNPQATQLLLPYQHLDRRLFRSYLGYQLIQIGLRQGKL